MVAEPQLIAYQPEHGWGDGLSARALLASIRRHLRLVVASTLLLCLVGGGLGLGLPIWFQAESVLIVHARPQRMADAQEMPDPIPDLATIRSEVDMLQSRSVIEPVVRSLELWRAPEFQKREYPGGWSLENLQDRLRDMWSAISGATEEEASTPPLATASRDLGEQPSQDVIDNAVEIYGRYLYVSNDGRSMTIRVGYRAWTPERAAAIVNAHAESYQNLQEQLKLKAAERANAAFNNQVRQMQTELQTAETAITRYREVHHLTGAARDSATLSQQLASLNSQLITARADLAEAEARAARIGESTGGKAGADSVPEVIASGTITVLRGQEAQLIQREADLSKDHGDAYPELRRVRASLQNLRAQISREIARGHAAALQLVERSRTRERSIQQSIVDLTKQVNSADAGLQQLQGDADSIRRVLENFQKRAQETAASPAFVTVNSTIASRANSTAVSASQRAPMLAFGGGFIGFTLGTLLSILLELRDKTFRTSGQVEQEIGSLRVGATPRVTRRTRASPADIVLDDYNSVFAEAIRLSWANIQLASDHGRHPSFAGRGTGVALGITSASTGEGKSTHALALARTAALAGERVALVDADLRRSGVSQLVEGSFCFTLRDFLQGRCAIDQVIAVEERSGVHVVPSTPTGSLWTTQDIQRFMRLIEHLKEQFAVVIIDLPPVLGLAETIRLSLAADTVALIIRWGRTERQFVQFALDALHNAGAYTKLAILNDIDLRAQQRRGYRDRTAVYTDEGLYRAASEEPASQFPDKLPAAAGADAVASGASPETRDRPVEGPDFHHGRAADTADAVNTSTAAISDIQRLYERYNR